MKFFASLLTVAILAFGTVSATFSQGSLNLTRDYLIEYNPKYFGTDTESFCKTFRKECVAYAGPRDQHHQLDAVFAQGNPLFAFCGGIAKSATGDWAVGELVIDHTEAILAASHATLVAVPLGPVKCRKYKKTHPETIC